MRTRSIVLVPVVALAATLLSGCIVGTNTSPTVAAEEIADKAESALENQTGVRPDIDCGEDPIPVESDTTVTCLLIDPIAGLEFDVVITFDEVVDQATGLSYTIFVKVADVPNNATAPTATPGVSVPITDIQALAIRALTPTLDFVPEVLCTATELEIVVGNSVECAYDSPDGTVSILVTITEFDPNTGVYKVRVTEV